MIDSFLNIPTGFRIIIETLIVLLVIMLCYFISYSPKIKEIKNTQREYDGLYLKVVNIIPEVTYDKHDKSQVESDMMQESYEKIIDMLPLGLGDYDILYDELVNLANICAIELNSFEASRRKVIPVDTFHSKVAFELEIVGSFQNMVAFLYKLNSLNNILELKAFNIKPASKRTVSDSLLFEGSFLAYIFNVG